MKYEVKIKKLPKSEVEIEVSLPSDLLDSARTKALEMFRLSIELPGFRKGHASEKMVLEKVGEAKLLEESADILLKEHFYKIIEQEKFDIIGRPNISITKLAIGNPLEFKAVFAILPEFNLPDYQAIAKSSVASSDNEDAKLEKNDLEASEKEIEEVLLQIRKNKAHVDWHKNNPDDTEHNHPDLEKEENLPALDDQLAKQAGNFKNLEELKTKIKENIKQDKKIKTIEKRRALIMESLVKETNFELPEILIESETEKNIARMKDDIAGVGGKWQDYLNHINKKEEDIKKDLRESSINRAKIQLIFNKIAEAEKLEPNKEILENEVKEILKHYPDASEQNARIYVATTLLNSEVLKLLES